MIDRRLHALRAVHQYGTVTAAAHALHFTPSAVSQQIRQLSAELDVALLEQHGRNVRLTDAALTLVSYADTLFAQWEEARAQVAEHAEGATGVLRVCGFPSAIAGVIAPAMADLRATYPRLSVHVNEVCATEGQTNEGLNLLLAGETDIAVMAPPPHSPRFDDPRFDAQPLLNEPQDLLVPTSHPLASREAVTLGDASCDTWIVPGAGSSDQHELTLVACAAAGFAPSIAHEVKDWPAVAALVAHGLGVALVPRLACFPSDESVVRVPVSGDTKPTRRILTYVRRGSREHPTIRRGLDALQAVADGCTVRPPLIEPPAYADRS